MCRVCFVVFFCATEEPAVASTAEAAKKIDDAVTSALTNGGNAVTLNYSGLTDQDMAHLVDVLKTRMPDVKLLA